MGRPKRNVLAAAEAAMSPPDTLTPSQSLARIIKPEGNNLYTCELPDNTRVILELAQMFRNTLWVRRGGFVVAEKYPSDSEETRAGGEIVNIVRDEKAWRKQSYWPEEFSKTMDESEDEDESNVGKMPPSDSEDE